MVATIHYLYLLFCSSLYARVVSKTTPDMFGGIIGAENGSALTPGPVAGSWNDERNGFVSMLVGSSASGYYFDDAIISELQDKLDNY